MKNVTPRPPGPYVPPGLDRESYLAGVFDERLGQAERNYWFSRGYLIAASGKLVPVRQ